MCLYQGKSKVLLLDYGNVVCLLSLYFFCHAILTYWPKGAWGSTNSFWPLSFEKTKLMTYLDVFPGSLSTSAVLWRHDSLAQNRPFVCLKRGVVVPTMKVNWGESRYTRFWCPPTPGSVTSGCLWSEVSPGRWVPSSINFYVSPDWRLLKIQEPR